MRPIDTNTQSSLNAKQSNIAILTDITLASGTLNVWSGYGSLTYNGVTYSGVGELGKVSVVQETNSVFASGATIELSGVNETDLTEALSDIRIGMPCTVYLASVTPGSPTAAASVLGTPIPIFAGETDQPSIVEGVTHCTIKVDIESKMAQLQRNREYRYTDQMQRFLYPGDGAFRYVNILQNYLGSWGYQQGNS